MLSTSIAPFSNPTTRANTYDANGNRTSVTRGSGPAADLTTSTLDAQDRMKTSGDFDLTYNANGELTKKKKNRVTGDETTYAYSTLGDLIGAVTPAGDRIDYILDGLGRRTGKKVNGTLTQCFLYAPGIGGPVAQLGGDGNVVARFSYATHTNVPDYITKNGNTYRVITDQLGSPRMVVNADTGAVAQELEYDEFGRVLSDSNPGFQPFGFAGGIYDSGTGLTHFGAREYDAGLGRWTAADPISFHGGDSNLYGYVLGDPINVVDPSGQAGVVTTVNQSPVLSAVSNFAAGTLNGMFMNIPNYLAGVSGKCIGKGGGAGKWFGTVVALLYGGAELRGAYLGMQEAGKTVEIVQTFAPSRVPEMEAAVGKATNRFTQHIFGETGQQAGGKVIEHHNDAYSDCC